MTAHVEGILIMALVVMLVLMQFRELKLLRKLTSKEKELSNVYTECSFWISTTRKYRDLAIEAAGGEPNEAILALDKTTVEYMDEGNRSSGA